MELGFKARQLGSRDPALKIGYRRAILKGKGRENVRTHKTVINNQRCCFLSTDYILATVLGAVGQYTDEQDAELALREFIM